MFLRLFLKDGLWRGRFLGWINAEDYGKTATIFEYKFTNDGTSFFFVVGQKTLNTFLE